MVKRTGQEGDVPFTFVLERMGYALCTLTPELQVRDWSDAMQRLTGLAADAVQGRALVDVWPAVGETVLVNAWQVSARQHTPTSVEASVALPDGETIVLEARTEPLREGMLLLVRDVSARYSSETEALRALYRLRSYLNTDTDAVLFLSQELRISEANVAALRLLGSVTKGLVGLAVSDVLPDLDPQVFCAEVGDRPPQSNTVRLQRDDGERVVLSVMAIPIGGGEDRAYALRLRDITDQLLTEEALWESNERFQALVEAAEDMIFVIDNELRLMFINQRTADYLRCTGSDVIGRKVSDVFGDELSELLTVYHQQLLVTGKSVEYEAPLPQGEGEEPIWSHTLLVPLRDSSGSIIASTGIARDLSETLRMHQQAVEMERLTTAQKMANAVSHEFSQPMQALQLMVEGILRNCQPEQAEDLQVIVERIHFLVDRVKQLSHVESLPFVEEVVEGRHPAEAPPAEAVVADEPPAIAETTEEAQQCKRVLVVDDEEMIRELLQAVMEQFGFEVATATDGTYGWDMVQEERFGMVLSDIAMPGMDGITLFTKVREARPELPFVLMSGYAVSSEDSNTVEQADAFLQKPFGVDKVHDILVQVFGEAAVES